MFCRVVRRSLHGGVIGVIGVIDVIGVWCLVFGTGNPIILLIEELRKYHFLQ